MSETFFENVNNIVTKNINEVYQYSDKNFNFIRILFNKLAVLTGGQLGKNIFLGDKNNQKCNPNNHIQDLVLIEDNFFYSFIIIFLVDSTININNCGISFKEKGLLPTIGIGLSIAIKQEEDFFIVRGVACEDSETVPKVFKINPNDDLTYNDFFESIIAAALNIFERDLKSRMNRSLNSSSDNKSTFGFNWSLD